MESSEFGYHT